MEEFLSSCEHFSPLIEAVGAFGTLGAVIVSLFFSYKSSVAHKPKIRAKLRIQPCFTANPPERHDLLVCHIFNSGAVQLQIPEGFCSITNKFGERLYHQILRHHLFDNKKYPFTLNAGCRETFILEDVSEFDKAALQFGRFRGKFLVGNIDIKTGRIFKAKIHKTVKKPQANKNSTATTSGSTRQI